MLESRFSPGFRGSADTRPDARIAAAAGTEGWLSHRAASWLWRFLEEDEPKPEVTVRSHGVRAIEGLLIHRSLLLDPRDCTRHRGIPVTSAARTIVDLASVLDERPPRQAVRRRRDCGASAFRCSSEP
jgi:hypothetical protein